MPVASVTARKEVILNGQFYATIPGDPLPQGSKRPIRNKATGRLSVIDNNPRLAQWRMAVTGWVKQAMADQPEVTTPIEGPLKVEVWFALRRPRSHYGTGANEHKVKASSPHYPDKYPDLDKLVRAILDGCTDAGLWLDDGQVVWLDVHKGYARWDAQPGAAIIVGRL